MESDLRTGDVARLYIEAGNAVASNFTQCARGPIDLDE
jgi:hypothetical protein